jgi:protein-disulfide isomerase
MNLEKLSVPIAIVIAGGLIAVSLYYSNAKAPVKTVKNNVGTTVDKNTDMRPVDATDHILGNPNADIIIVEYSDTECPYCKVFHNTLKRVMSEYGNSGKVAWVYRHFPIQQLHKKARKEAEALECANDLGGPSKFWEYTNLLYDTTNSNDSLPESELPRMAGTVGLDVNAFNACLSSGKFAGKVEEHYQDAVRAGGTGTPNSILILKDGTKTNIVGAQPYENLKAVIDAMLE